MISYHAEVYNFINHPEVSEPFLTGSCYHTSNSQYNTAFQVGFYPFYHHIAYKNTIYNGNAEAISFYGSLTSLGNIHSILE